MVLLDDADGVVRDCGFVFYAVVVAAGAGTVSEVWGEIQRAAGATERLMELLDTRPALSPAAPVINLPPRTDIPENINEQLIVELYSK